MRTPLLALLLAIGCRDKSAAVDSGTLGTTPGAADADGDGYLTEEDCDDADDQISPAAEELCDGIDNDCDGEIDEGVTATFYADGDGDGFGDASAVTESCSEPTGYVGTGNDCDDADADSYPGAAERCDGADNDCDGDTDEDVVTAWHADADSDGYGDPDAVIEDCDPPDGYTDDDTDCDDLDGTAYPGAAEVCDGADNDCDDSIDEDTTATFYQDADSDGYGVADVTTEACDLPTGYAARAGDCDDTDGTVSPNAAELCDGADNDCDGDTDEDDAADASVWYGDDDGDSYGDAADAAVACDQPSGYVADATDCDDSAAGTNPGAAEVCDGADNDCDGSTDEDDATDASVWYADSDGDGYGGASSTVACDQPAGFADNSDDCDDAEAGANPGEAEVCDEIDNDCDGAVDEGVTSDWYLDYDADGYGAGSAVSACAAPTGRYVADDGDCDDTDADYSPGAAEGCDGEDYDCDGDVDNDADGDGYADEACGGDDCADSDSNVTPDASGGCALGTDCYDIVLSGLDDGDGTYTIDPDGADTGDDPFDVTCDMTTDGGGWTVVVDDDYSSDACPGSWARDSAQGVCHRDTARGSAVAADIDTLGITYEEVRGALTLYQYASTNAYWYAAGRTIDDIYVDGVSLTVGGSGAREHVFTYAVGYSDSVGYVYDCPALGGNSPPSFVGSDYLCDSGNSGTTYSYTWYSPALFAADDFQVTLSGSTTDDVEVRIMCDEEASSLTYSEDVGVRAMLLAIR